MSNAQRDQNSVTTLLGVSSVDGVTPTTVYVNPITHRVLVDLPSGTGTVTSVSVVSANGFAGTVATATTTPAITISTTITGIIKGNGTAISAASAGTDYAGLASNNTFTGVTTLAKVVQTVTAMSAQALDGTLGNVFTRTLAGSETFTQSGFTAGQCFMVEVTQGSGTSFTVTWFAGVTWVTAGATAPTQTVTSSGITTYGFRCTGSNTFLGYLIGTQ